jgi:hypothetical protein
MNPDWLQIRYLKTAELVVVTGAGATAAVKWLCMEPLTGEVPFTQFNDCLFVNPAKYARIMRRIANDTGRPSIIAPLNKGRAVLMIDVADLYVVEADGRRPVPGADAPRNIRGAPAQRPDRAASRRSARLSASAKCGRRWPPRVRDPKAVQERSAR